MARLTEAEIQAGLRGLPDWHLDGQVIRRTFRLADFRAAVAFVNRLADAAEEMEHHPDIDIRYDRVTLVLTTHDAGGLTELDLRLAARADRLAAAG
jgi:4a-hydroxytetrahydrobiopterin dehydratase